MNEFIKWASVLNRHLNIILDKALEELDINSSQYFYITKICSMPGISQEKLFSLFYRNPSNITRALAVLIEKGYMEKKSLPDDKRAYCVFPTQKAFDSVDKINYILKKTTVEVLEDFSPEEKELFLKFLKKSAIKAYEIKQTTEEEKWQIH